MTERQAAEVRRRQFAAAAVAWPAWLIARCVLFACGAWLSWDHLSRPVICAVVLVGVGCSAAEGPVALALARAASRRPGMEGLYLGCVLGFAVTIALAMAELIIPVDSHVRIMGTAVVGGLIGYMAWARACLPRVAVTWIAAFSSVLTAVLLVVGGTWYLEIVVLLAVDSLFAIFYVVQDAVTYLVGLRSRLKVVEQRETLDLLLSEFESGANDWLWETDPAGRLVRVSARLAELLGQPIGDVSGRRWSSLMTPAREEDFEELTSAFARGRAFRELTLQVRAAGELRHLRLSAKPTEDGGWRGVGTDVTAERRAQEELVALAEFDSLTGLANRHRILRALRAALADGQGGACTLLLLDLDGFKWVNDTLGHGAGDELLREVARRLRALVEPEQLVGRLGGDEFVLLVPGVDSPTQVTCVFSKIETSLSAPVEIQGRTVRTQVSGGAASASEAAPDAERLLANADLALYEAKRDGGGRLAQFVPELAHNALARRARLEDLRLALPAGELFLLFQPQVDSRTTAVIGYEALLRWNHPQRGLVSPADFIPLAEESGLILEIGEWVLTQACAAAVAMPEDRTIAVNVSPRQFAGDVPAAVARALTATGLDGRRLVVEITESTLIANGAQVHDQLQRIRDLGVRVALDDFGTGYSALSYLRSLPLDELKIDRSFALEAAEGSRPKTLALVQAIVAMAAALDLATTAEGIETDEQLTRFQHLGVDAIQGFVYARPLPLAEALAFSPGVEITPRRDDLAPAPV